MIESDQHLTEEHPTEQAALELAGDRKRLLRRLKEGRAGLVEPYRSHFKTYRFDFERKRLVSEDGQYFLIWKVRYQPDQPISYENQQTSEGVVMLYKKGITADDVRRKLEEFFKDCPAEPYEES